MRRRMSERERLYFFAFLFPPLWPLGIAMAMCEICEASGRGIVRLWTRLKSAR